MTLLVRSYIHCIQHIYRVQYLSQGSVTSLVVVGVSVVVVCPCTVVVAVTVVVVLCCSVVVVVCCCCVVVVCAVLQSAPVYPAAQVHVYEAASVRPAEQSVLHVPPLAHGDLNKHIHVFVITDLTEMLIVISQYIGIGPKQV